MTIKRQGADEFTPVREEVLTIALVNSMPNAAFRVAEKQFCDALFEASAGIAIQLRLYSPPELSRPEELRRHIDQFYEKFEDLEEFPPDGIIVTGSEPAASRLEDEPLWPTLKRLVDFTESAGIASVWSCMAAHAAVYRLTGRHRQLLEHKLSGLFKCDIHHHTGFWSPNAPNTWKVPHSRRFGLTSRQLRSSDFAIFSSSIETGPDVFALHAGGQHLFFQGHPEYEPAALVSEYRRDIRRYFNGELNSYPLPPHGYYGPAIRGKLQTLEAAVTCGQDPNVLRACEDALLDLSTTHDWQAGTRSIYRGWLRGILSRRRQLMPQRLRHITRAPWRYFASDTAGFSFDRNASSPGRN